MWGQLSALFGAYTYLSTCVSFFEDLIYVVRRFGIQHILWTTDGKYCLQRSDEYSIGLFQRKKFRIEEVRSKMKKRAQNQTLEMHIFPSKTSPKSEDQRFYVPLEVFALGSEFRERRANYSRLTSRRRGTGRLLGEENSRTENGADIFKKMDAPYGIYLLKSCFSLPKILYILRTSPCFNHETLREKYDRTVIGAFQSIQRGFWRCWVFNYFSCCLGSVCVLG